ncbi:MAG: AMP-binding protein [Bacteroidetes bacterium]|nr:AMP-binding protein [Fibrella sp.]
MLLFDPGSNARPDPSTDYEADAVAFCRAWQSGQTDFTLHTSGSTGAPKPITLTRRQMQASARLTGQTFGLQPGDSILVCLNIRYIAGVMMLVRGLELGLPMTIIEPAANPLTDFDPATTRFAFTAFVPLQLQTILTDSPEKLPIINGAKAILVGGAATSPVLEQALQAITAPVYATYGMTETVSHIATRRLNGPPIDATDTDVFTALAGVDLGVDERDCLTIRAAASDFQLIQTNDVVELITPVRFRLLGRADTIINSGGVKIQPERIERLIQTTLSRSGEAPRLFVAGIPDERLGQRVVVFVENQSLDANLWARIQAIIRAELGAYWVPRELVHVGRFAETPTGKVDKLATMGLKS